MEMPSVCKLSAFKKKYLGMTIDPVKFEEHRNVFHWNKEKGRISYEWSELDICGDEHTYEGDIDVDADGKIVGIGSMSVQVLVCDDVRGSRYRNVRADYDYLDWKLEDIVKPVKASELIACLKARKLKADVTDDGDLRPGYRGTSIDVDEDHRCTIRGSIDYAEDTVREGVDFGRADCVVLGVSLHTNVLSDEDEIEDADIEIEGEVEYDDGLTSDDVVDVARERISWPVYNPDDFQFREESLTAEAIIEGIDDDESMVFAIDNDENVYGYDEDEEVPATQTVVDHDTAYEILARKRPGFEIV